MNRHEQSERKPAALLLDLSGNNKAALEWADKHLHAFAVKLINKADLKWGSKREALRQFRGLAPGVFAIFTSDLESQSARGPMILFGILSGARRVVMGDRSGRTLARTRLSVIAIEAPRLAFELLFGYAVIVPISWLLTFLIGAALALRNVVRASRNQKQEQSNERRKLTALYVRATIVSPAATTGGMASHIRGFTRGALALSHHLRFITSSDAGINDQVEVKLVKPSTGLSATRALFELWNNLVFTARSLQHASAETGLREVAFIYQRYSRFNWTGVVLSLMTGLPLLLEFNGSEVWVSRHWDPVGQLSLLARFERLNLRAADLIFVVSDVERRRLVAAGVDSRRIVVNPNGVDADEFRPDCGGSRVRRALGIEDKTVVGFAGTFGPWHGAPALAEAAARVSDGARCHFLFIGDGDERSLTESIIAASAGRAQATFTGRVAHDKVAAYLDACDILASPQMQSADGSEFFGSPTKLFEYMAMAKPVVASRLGQIADVIIDGENGILVEPGSADDLARAIEKLASDKGMRARLGARARQTVIERYTWQHNAARVFNAARDRAGTH